MNSTLVEWIGYIASAMIVVSLIMTSIVKLRIINTIGCVLFVIYGIIVGAYPISVSNGLIALINLYNLYKLKHKPLDEGKLA
ncbi:YgjV family protein [Clostridium sp.]|uniref:YgjV family protein n=1 Tax=Clostridium sp. TaxID=1506 RepID=UPI0026DD3E40|nr:YgjV family protein [Clostridium sp.]MDO5039409.1 YgjV family protein [Clostridium sp.]